MGCFLTGGAPLAGVITIPCPPRASFVPGSKPVKKARPRRLRRSWVKQYNAALRVYRKELVRLAGSHMRWTWPNFTRGRAQVLATESRLPLPRSLRRAR